MYPKTSFEKSETCMLTGLSGASSSDCQNILGVAGYSTQGGTGAFTGRLNRLRAGKNISG